MEKCVKKKSKKGRRLGSKDKVARKPRKMTAKRLIAKVKKSRNARVKGRLASINYAYAAETAALKAKRAEEDAQDPDLKIQKLGKNTARMSGRRAQRPLRGGQSNHHKFDEHGEEASAHYDKYGRRLIVTVDDKDGFDDLGREPTYDERLWGNTRETPRLRRILDSTARSREMDERNIRVYDDFCRGGNFDNMSEDDKEYCTNLRGLIWPK